jgi:hypothetical protein
MPCRNDPTRLLNWPWTWPLCAGLDKGGLKVELAWERFLNESTGPGDWGLGARLSMASCARASSPPGTGGSGLAVWSRQDITKGTIYIVTYVLPIKLNTPRFCKTKPFTPLESTNLSRGGRIIDTKSRVLQNEAVNPFRINALSRAEGEIPPRASARAKAYRNSDSVDESNSRTFYESGKAANFLVSPASFSDGCLPPPISPYRAFLHHE